VAPVTDQKPHQASPLDTLKSFTHPLRLRLFYALGLYGSATATTLAKEVGTTAQLAYYHLTRLAELGAVVEDHDHPTKGRERYWRHASRGFSFNTDDVAELPQGVEQMELLHRAQATVHFEYFSKFLQGYSGPPQFRAAAFGTDDVLQLTYQQMLDLEAEINAVLKRFRDLTAANPALAQGQQEDDDEPTAKVMASVHGFPIG